MGVPALLFALPLAIKNARDTSGGTGARGPVTYADNAGEPGWASTMRVGSQAMRHFSAGSAAAGGAADGDSIAQLERLQRLREQGALTEAEFEAQKRRILRR